MSGPDRTGAILLLYRRVLGAWQFLLGVQERAALAKLQALTELERTP